MTENSTAVLVAAPLPLFLELSQMRFLQMTGSQVSQSSYVCHWNDLFFVGGVVWLCVVQNLFFSQDLN